MICAAFIYFYVDFSVDHISVVFLLSDKLSERYCSQSTEPLLKLTMKSHRVHTKSYISKLKT